MAEYSNLTLEVQDRIAVLSVNRPDKLNALNEQTIRELGQAIDEITGRDDVGGVILTGVARRRSWPAPTSPSWRRWGRWTACW